MCANYSPGVGVFWESVLYYRRTANRTYASGYLTLADTARTRQFRVHNAFYKSNRRHCIDNGTIKTFHKNSRHAVTLDVNSTLQADCRLLHQPTFVAGVCRCEQMSSSCRHVPPSVYKYEPLNQRHNYGVLRVGFNINMAAIDITMWNVTYSQHDGLQVRSKFTVQTSSCSQLCAMGGECMWKSHVICMMRRLSEKRKAWT